MAAGTCAVQGGEAGLSGEIDISASLEDIGHQVDISGVTGEADHANAL